jgi:hypothetical protein
MAKAYVDYGKQAGRGNNFFLKKMKKLTDE